MKKLHTTITAGGLFKSHSQMLTCTLKY